VGPILITLLARRFTDRGHADGNITAGMIGGFCAMLMILVIQFAPSAFWAFVLYIPAMAAINSPFGIAAGALPVITPPRMRATVAAFYMLVGALGMMLGPPMAGAFNQFIFPGPEGVRYSLITVTCIFGSIGVVSLWFGRRHYARSMTLADSRFSPTAAER
jgi:MFS family permease